ncbi:MAG TPA: Ig-like domain-containing protein, partial [Verrucomicrobiae bacterium]
LAAQTSDKNGLATFTGLTFTNTGSGLKLVAEATSCGSDTTQPFNISQGNSTTTLTASGNNLIYGQTLSLNVSVKKSGGGASQPTGNVSFLEGSLVLATQVLDANGSATLVLSNQLAVGNHLLTATYAGNAGFSASTSSAMTVVVNPVATAVTLLSNLNPARTNQIIAFAATIAAGYANGNHPTGTVRLKANGAKVVAGPVTLTNGIATLLVPALQLAVSTNVVVSAEFSDPTGNFSASTNSTMQVLVLNPPAIGAISLAPTASNGRVQLSLQGTSGQLFIIEASTDALHWSPIATNVADANGLMTLLESNSAAFPCRFYRGVMPAQ